MTGIDDVFWNSLDARIAGSVQRPATPAPAARPLATADAVTDRHVVADWTGLVDTISAAGAAAQVQTVAYETMASDLAQALAEVDALRTLLAQSQAQSLATTREIRDAAQARIEAVQARAEARIEAIQAQADTRARRAEERAARADQRVAVIEDWLAQVEQASRSLLPDNPRPARRLGGSAAA